MRILASTWSSAKIAFRPKRSSNVAGYAQHWRGWLAQLRSGLKEFEGNTHRPSLFRFWRHSMSFPGRNLLVLSALDVAGNIGSSNQQWSLLTALVVSWGHCGEQAQWLGTQSMSWGVLAEDSFTKWQVTSDHPEACKWAAEAAKPPFRSQTHQTTLKY